MKKLIGIDIFSGAGGLSLGALAAGIQIPIAIEKDLFAAQTFKRNHPETTVITKDIKEIDTKDLNIEVQPLIIQITYLTTFLYSSV
jgi:DNA (cytosine-5)-methyltransferase 1